MLIPLEMDFTLKCEVCKTIIKSHDFWIHKLYCTDVQFKKITFLANKENILKLFGRQAQLIMQGTEKGLRREKVKEGSSHRVTTTESCVKIDFDSSVFTSNTFEAHILNLGFADHLHTKLGKDILIFTKNSCFDDCQITFEMKNTGTFNNQSVVLKTGNIHI